MKIKKSLITRIVGNRHACSLLIAIVFLFTETGYSANGPSKLRPALQFSNMGRRAITGMDFGPALFIDSRDKKVRSLSDDEHRVLNEALTQLAFARPEEGDVEFLSDKKSAELFGGSFYKIKERVPPEVRIIGDAAFLRALPDKYKYLAEGLITHAGIWRADSLSHQHANIFMLRSVYEMLHDYATNYSRHEFLSFWRDHELKHLADRTAPIDMALIERE